MLCSYEYCAPIAVNVNHVALESLARFVARVARMPALSHLVDAHGRNLLLASYLAYCSAIPGTLDFGARTHHPSVTRRATRYCTKQSFSALTYLPDARLFVGMAPGSQKVPTRSAQHVRTRNRHVWDVYMYSTVLYNIL